MHSVATGKRNAALVFPHEVGASHRTPGRGGIMSCRGEKEVRMQEVSAVQDYRDVDLDDSTYKRVAMSRLLRNDAVKDVVGN